MDNPNDYPVAGLTGRIGEVSEYRDSYINELIMARGIHLSPNYYRHVVSVRPFTMLAAGKFLAPLAGICTLTYISKDLTLLKFADFSVAFEGDKFILDKIGENRFDFSKQDLVAEWGYRARFYFLFPFFYNITTKQDEIITPFSILAYKNDER